MDSVEALRRIATEELIPQVSRDGLGHVHLPQSFGPQSWLKTTRWRPPYYHHRAVDIGCFLSGAFRLWIDNHLVEMAPGDVVLIPPHVGHCCDSQMQRVVHSLERSAAPTVLWMGLCPWGVLAQLSQLAGPVCRTLHPVVFADARCYDAGEMLIAELTAKPDAYETVGLALLVEILGRMSRAPVLSRPIAEALSEDAPGDEAGDLVSTAKRYIRANFGRPLTLQAIADHLFVSRSQLTHKFKDETGQTTMEYLTEVRIATAKQLLRTSLSVHTIASLVGFSDPQYFSRVFRRVVGESPTASRARPSPPGC
ncbi:MAG TPA: AraC family transcriptional regulator [Armatimonadota bacterium]|jgi:AraC-like DNA-binding protein|nr:AraC family transcriptional regulator [Armatimonadota bacterium]